MDSPILSWSLKERKVARKASKRVDIPSSKLFLREFKPKERRNSEPFKTCYGKLLKYSNTNVLKENRDDYILEKLIRDEFLKSSNISFTTSCYVFLKHLQYKQYKSKQMPSTLTLDKVTVPTCACRSVGACELDSTVTAQIHPSKYADHCWITQRNTQRVHWKSLWLLWGIDGS